MAAPASEAQAALTLTSCSLTVSGTPSAVPLAPATLVRMSWRTMPARIRALATPLTDELVPSAGYGPPVSSGMTLQVALLAVVPVVPVLPLPLVVAVVALVLVVPALPPPQLASGRLAAVAAAPANSQRSDWRRLVVRLSIASMSSARLCPWAVMGSFSCGDGLRVLVCA